MRIKKLATHREALKVVTYTPSGHRAVPWAATVVVLGKSGY